MAGAARRGRRENGGTEGITARIGQTGGGAQGRPKKYRGKIGNGSGIEARKSRKQRVL